MASETALAAIEAKHFAHRLRVQSLRGLASGLKAKAPTTGHVFWALAKELAETAQELEEATDELALLKREKVSRAQ